MWGGGSEDPVKLVKLLASTDHQVILSYSTGRMVTVVLPSVGSPLVCSALATAQLLLPRDLAISSNAAWYSERHAPGQPPSPAKEWNIFFWCLLSLAGYQVDLLNLSPTSQHNSGSGEAMAGPSKKCRQSESGFDADWQFLWSLHLLYEDLKLDLVQADQLPRLAADLQLS